MRLRACLKTMLPINKAIISIRTVSSKFQCVKEIIKLINLIKNQTIIL